MRNDDRNRLSDSRPCSDTPQDASTAASPGRGEESQLTRPDRNVTRVGPTGQSVHSPGQPLVQMRIGPPCDPCDQVRAGDGVARCAVALRFPVGDRDGVGDSRPPATAASARRGRARWGGGRGRAGDAADAVDGRCGSERDRGVRGVAGSRRCATVTRRTGGSHAQSSSRCG